MYMYVCKYTQPRAPSLPVFGSDLPAVYRPYPPFKTQQIARVLRPGGMCIMSMSNRCFPTKAINLWLETGDQVLPTCRRPTLGPNRSFTYPFINQPCVHPTASTRIKSSACPINHLFTSRPTKIPPHPRATSSSSGPTSTTAAKCVDGFPSSFSCVRVIGIVGDMLSHHHPPPSNTRTSSRPSPRTSAPAPGATPCSSCRPLRRSRRHNN